MQTRSPLRLYPYKHNQEPVRKDAGRMGKFRQQITIALISCDSIQSWIHFEAADIEGKLTANTINKKNDSNLSQEEQ